MSKSRFRWLMAALFAALIVLGQSAPLQRLLDERGWVPRQYAYGDLYNMTNLRAYREDNFETNAMVPLAERPTRKFSNVNFYVIGDSFTDMDTSYYAGAHNGHTWTGGHVDTLQPANGRTRPGRKQIMVIEFIERVLQERLYWPDYQDVYIDRGIAVAGHKPVIVPKAEQPVPWYRWRFGEQINQRLEFLLFNFKPILWFKEQKSQLMYSAFGRVHAGELIDGKLFYDIEAADWSRQSAFIPIADRQIDSLVTNLNTIRNHYLRAGLDEVYFCFIPNKATIFNYHRPDYNHQIERLEAHPRLEAPLLTMIDTLRARPDWYHTGDGHWNRDGRRYFLRRVNDLIADWHNGKPPKGHILR
jgi:hypothetical protein